MRYDLPFKLPIVEHIVFSGDTKRVSNLCEVLALFNRDISYYMERG